MSQHPGRLLFGQLRREYILPPGAAPVVDACGGSLAYAAGGLAVWGKGAGLVARVGRDYPEVWIRELANRGFDTQGIQLAETELDLRSFVAYTATFAATREGPVTQFSQRGYGFPKSLLGYRPLPALSRAARLPDPLSPIPAEVPPAYRSARFVHLCPLDFPSQTRFVAALAGFDGIHISLEPSPEYMVTPMWRDLRMLMRGVSSFQPSEEELRQLFRGETHDLWEMGAVCAYITACHREKGAQGRYLFDSSGAAGGSSCLSGASPIRRAWAMLWRISRGLESRIR
jgi:sugar/nucleoside kinase (ribokinase family)